MSQEDFLPFEEFHKAFEDEYPLNFNSTYEINDYNYEDLDKFSSQEKDTLKNDLDINKPILIKAETGSESEASGFSLGLIHFEDATGQEEELKENECRFTEGFVKDEDFNEGTTSAPEEQDHSSDPDFEVSILSRSTKKTRKTKKKKNRRKTGRVGIQLRSNAPVGQEERTRRRRIRYPREEYICGICPYKCTVENSYLSHQESHRSGRSIAPFSCVVCGTDRTSQVSLNQHLTKHKLGPFYCCDLCIFKTKQLKKLIQHRRMHTGERPHLCPHCSYRAARRDNLRSHVRRVHFAPDLFRDTFIHAQ